MSNEGQRQRQRWAVGHVVTLPERAGASCAASACAALSPSDADTLLLPLLPLPPPPSPAPSSLLGLGRRLDLLRFLTGASPSPPPASPSDPGSPPWETLEDRLLRDLRGVGMSAAGASSGFAGSSMAFAASSSPSVGVIALDRRLDDRKLPRDLTRGASDSPAPSTSRAAAPAATATAR